MGDKPGKYWDYNECRWVACPTPAEEIVALRAPANTVPAQQDVQAAEAEDETVVGAPI